MNGRELDDDLQTAPAQVHASRVTGLCRRGEGRSVRGYRAAVLPPVGPGCLPGPQGVVVVGCQNRFVDVPGISTGLNPRRARIAQICEYVLEQRAHAPEQDRQDGREVAMGHRVKVVDVRKEHGITVLTDLDVRGKPLELVRQRVARLVRAQARPGGVVRAAHPAHQAKQ